MGGRNLSCELVGGLCQRLYLASYLGDNSEAHAIVRHKVRIRASGAHGEHNKRERHNRGDLWLRCTCGLGVGLLGIEPLHILLCDVALLAVHQCN